MPTGPGKYDDACTLARAMTKGQAVLLVVLNGKAGSGFSVQSEGQDISARLPDLLEWLALDIRRSLENQTP